MTNNTMIAPTKDQFGPPRGWIGIDLDGTLAEYHGYQGPDHIGKPIRPTLDFVNWLLAEGWEVRIFTARVGPQKGGGQDIVHAVQAIRAWCMKHLGRELAVTSEKDYGMVWLYDDRCTQVIKNMGKPVDPPLDFPQEAPHHQRNPNKERSYEDERSGKRPHRADSGNGSQGGTQDPGAGTAGS